MPPVIRILPLLTVLFLSHGCAPVISFINDPSSKGGMSDTFGYRVWKRDHYNQDIVIIGIHGFCGASADYSNLANYIVKRQPNTAVYAYEVRGQGSDPILYRRGDIGNPKQWYSDLDAFTQLVKKRHPKAKIVWYGESMGALIATHSLNKAPPNNPPCDALVLTSPIVRFKDDVEPWKVALVQVAAATAPLARIDLETLSGGEEIQMTQTSTHSAQSKTNSYHIEKHTLRLLAALGQLIDGMNKCAAEIKIHTLVLHGGKDYFNTDSDVRGFVARIPSTTSATYYNYPNAHHLLMYDAEKERIFRDVDRWLNQLRRK
jgi:alpha-beta hydrolase superfamily lysophospholipase